MLKVEELDAIYMSIRDALSDDPKPDWKESLSDALDLAASAIGPTERQERYDAYELKCSKEEGGE